MVKKLDEATKLLIESLPENLQNLATSAMDIGYMSRMDFTAATEADEVPEEEHDEVLDFFQQDLGIEILETDNDPQDMGRYYEMDDEEPRDKTRNLLNADAEQVDVNDDDYEHYAKQLERSQTGSLVLGVQDSVQSYLKQIGTVQLLTAAGEVAIAQRIEAASRLMVYGLCESPMTIKAIAGWRDELLDGSMQLRDIVDLEMMYGDDVDAMAFDDDESSGNEDLDKVAQELDEKENLDDIDDDMDDFYAVKKYDLD